MKTNEINIDGIYYLLDDEARTAKVIANPYLYEGDIDIPSHINHFGETYCVTSIGKDAFNGCSSLTGIKISENIVDIGESAFFSCSSLIAIRIPCRVITIGRGAFNECSSLQSIEVDVNNNKYDSRNSCNAIIESKSNTLILGCQKTIIPDDVTRIGADAFNGCFSLQSITIPKNVTHIDSYAFFGCFSLESILLPKNIVQIDCTAFSECYFIREKFKCTLLDDVNKSPYGATFVDFEEGGLLIKNNAIVRCRQFVTSANVPNGITWIAESAFAQCIHLATIVLPNTLYDIDNNAFNNCKSLMEIIIPDGVKEIGNWAFCDCSAIESIFIPKNVISIGDYAFCSCSSLKTMVVDTKNATYHSSGNCNAIIETATNKLIAGCKTTIIPKNITSIAEGAFTGCEQLKSPYLPDTLQEIGDLAFAGCINITHVLIPPNVTKIGEGVFGGCSSLECVFIESMILKCIGESIFYNCIKLKTIYVHKDKQEEYCNLGLNEYRKLIVDSGETKIQINHIANTKNSFFMDPEFVYNTIINKSQPIPKPVSTMSIAAFLTMKGCTPNEIRSGKVELRTTPSGVMRPAFVVKMVVLEVKEFVLYAHERYSLNTIEEMEKWIEDHNGKDLCVAYTDINNDLAYLCLKENKEQKLPNHKSATKAEYKIENTTENSSNTPSSNDGGSNDIGCIVLSIILAIAALILSILSTDSDTFASIGALVMFAVCAIAGYFIYKFTGSSKSTGCLPTIIGFIAFVFLFNVIGYNYEVNTTIGIIVSVIVFVIGLIYFLSQLNKSRKRR